MEKLTHNILVIFTVFLAVIIGINSSIHFKTDLLRWIYETQLLSSGRELYSEITWQYPPISIYIYSFITNFFGMTINGIIFINTLISGLIIFNLYKTLVNFDLKKPAAIIVIISCMFITLSSNHFRLFSLQLYTPAVIIGALGLTFVMSSIGSLYKHQNVKSSSLIFMILGVTLAILSKPEYGIGAIALAFLGTVKLKYYKTLVQGCLAVLALIYIFYLFTLAEVPLQSVIDGISGFGVSSGQFDDLPSIKVIIACIMLSICLFIYINSSFHIRYINLIGAISILFLALLAPGALDQMLTLIGSAIVIYYYANLLLSKTQFNIFPKLYMFLSFGFAIYYLRNLIWLNHFSLFIPPLIIWISILLYKASSKKFLNWISFLFLVSIANIAITAVEFSKSDTFGTELGDLRAKKEDVKLYGDAYAFITNYLKKSDLPVFTAPYGGAFEATTLHLNNFTQTQFVRMKLSERQRLVELKKLKVVGKFLYIRQVFNNNQLSIEKMNEANPEIFTELENNSTLLSSYCSDDCKEGINIYLYEFK